jgi:signal transduction histidine kinase
MSQVFVKESLFRPFHSTKKKGLGIGLFQSRAIVQAHRGGMHVESELGKGTTFLVSFPVKTQQ